MEKRAIVTGAGRGIGRVVSLGLVRDGFTVAGLARSESELLQVRREAESISPGGFQPGVLDITDVSALTAFINKTLSIWKRVDLLVNNAGIFSMGSSSAEYEDFSRMLDVNLKAVFLATKLVVPQMKKQRSGLIINISSMAGFTPFASTGAYSATKAGVNGWGESIFKELASSGISVTTICPSWVATDLSAQSGIPASEMIQPEDILNTIRYVLSLSPVAMVPVLPIFCRRAVG